MAAPRGCSDNATAVGSQERIFNDGRRAAATSSATKAVRNRPVFPEASEAALQKVVTPPLGTQGKTRLMP